MGKRGHPPRASSPRFRSEEGGSPYEPTIKVTVGHHMYGHHDEPEPQLDKDSPMIFADEAVASRVSSILLVIF